jgi:hypothetical protein
MDDVRDRSHEVWLKDEPLNYSSSLIEYSRVAAPLLAGFSLAAVVELAGGSRGLRGDIALVAFTAAACLLVFAIQTALVASIYQTPPADRMAWWPEAQSDRHTLARLRSDQWRDGLTARRIGVRVRWLFNLGIIGFLSGLIAVLVPASGGWNAARVGAIGCAGCAALIEIMGTLGRPRRILRHIWPTHRDLQEAERVRLHHAARMDEDELHAVLFDGRTKSRQEHDRAESALTLRVAQSLQDIARRQAAGGR